MEKWFSTPQEALEFKDLIDFKSKELELVGWSCRSADVIIRDWKFINYKSSIKLNGNYGNKSIHFNKIIFENCTFKDITFSGAVPLDGCVFKKCTFENCLFSDHIRWTKFNGCSFKFCLFSGYFHGSKFSQSCKFENVGCEYYGDNPFSPLKLAQTFINSSKKNKENKKELLRYFYPEQMKEVEKYQIGKTFLFKMERWENDNFWKEQLKEFKYTDIDGKKYYIDTMKQFAFGLSHFSPEISIDGVFSVDIKNCQPYNENLQTRHVIIDKIK